MLTMGADLNGMFVASALRAAQQTGQDVSRLVEGLSFSPQTVRRPRARVAWDDVALLFDRIADRGPEALEAFAEAWAHAIPPLQWLSMYATTPQSFYKVLGEACRRVFPFMECQVAATAGGALEWTAHLPPPHRGSLAFFQAGTTLLRVLSRMVGATEARVEAEVGSRGGRWKVELPRSDGGVDVEGKELSLGRLFSDFARELEDLGAPQRVEHHAVPLTDAERRVVDLLVRGITTKAIASTLGVSLETVRSHLKRAMSKFGVHRQHELVARALEPKSKRRRGSAQREG